MIEYHIGDLLTSDCTYIMHQANCQHVMGGGIARQIKEKFPFAYAADLATPKGDKTKLGTISLGRSYIPPLRYIINLYGQYGYGAYDKDTSTDIIALGNALIKAAEFLKQEENKLGLENIKVGIPRLGCGLGGAKWKDVEALINMIFSKNAYNRTIHVYDLPLR